MQTKWQAPQICPVCRSFPSQSPTSNASTSCNGIWKVPVKKSYYDAKQMTSFTWLVFVAAGEKSCDRQVYLLTVRKKRDDKTNKTLMLHLFIVTRGASSPNEPSSLGIFVLSDLSESCEPIESLAAKNSEVVQYDNCTWLGQDCELPSRLCCFDVSFSSTCHIRKWHSDDLGKV